MIDRIIFVCTLLLAGVYFWATAQIPSLDLGDPLGPKAFPRLLGAGLLLAAGMLLLEMLRKRRGDDGHGHDDAAPPASMPRWPSHQRVIVAVAAWTALFIAAFEPAGFVVATTVYLLGLMTYFNRNRWRMNMLTAVLFSVVSYAVFTRLLGVTLARGILPF